MRAAVYTGIDLHNFSASWREMKNVLNGLGDPTRRRLLDLLHERNGQTLGELISVGMTRRSATQHLAALKAANLISTVRRGREKLHLMGGVLLAPIGITDGFAAGSSLWPNSDNAASPSRCGVAGVRGGPLTATARRAFRVLEARP